MFFTKRIWKHGKKVKVGIHIERAGAHRYRITDFTYSRNGKDFIECTDDVLKNNELMFVVSQTFGVDNKLLYKGKRVDTCEVGALTVYVIGDNIVIPATLIDEAIEMF